MTAFLLALCASVSWGLSDFLGGVNTRQVPVLVVLAVSQVAGLVVLAVPLIARGRAPIIDGHLWYAFAAGAASVTALGLLYTAMARGSIIVVAPVAATGAVLPVIVGIAHGDAITALPALGIVLALLGALGAAWEPDTTRGRRGLMAGAALAFASAIGVGSFFTLLNMASVNDPYWATAIMRLTSCTIVLGFLTLRPVRGFHLGGLPRGTLVAIAAIGLTDSLAEILFAVASTSGALSVVSVLSSLYPVITVALALVLLRERVHWLQTCGAVSAMVGVILLAQVAV